MSEHGYTAPSGRVLTAIEMRDAAAKNLADQMLAGASDWLIEAALDIYREYKEAVEAEYRLALEPLPEHQPAAEQDAPATADDEPADDQDAPPWWKLHKHSRAECEAGKALARQQLIDAGVDTSRWDLDGIGCGQCDDAPAEATERGVSA